ncbi:carboxypeptidase-like regulatory domain-containing protein [Pedobacter sp. NJ-S-72]
MQIFTKQPFAFFILLLLTLSSFNTIAQQKHSFEGTVKDINGRPLEGAGITAIEVNKSSVTNASGEFSFKDLPAGIYKIRVRHMGYKEQTIKITLPLPETKKKNTIYFTNR